MVNIKEVVSLLGQPTIHFAQSSHTYLSNISVNRRYILFFVLFCWKIMLKLENVRNHLLLLQASKEEITPNRVCP